MDASGSLSRFGWACALPLVLAVGAWSTIAPSTAGAASGPSEAPDPGSAQVVLRQVSGAAWSEATEAIAFEMSQAGYDVVNPLNRISSSGYVLVELRRDLDQWEVRCIDGSAVEYQRGAVSDGPELVALLAVECVLAMRASARPPEPAVAAEAATAPPDPVPRSRQVPVVRAKARPTPDVPRRWAGQVGATLMTVGTVSGIGAEAGVRRTWARWELAALVGGGALQHSEAYDGSGGTSTSLQLRALARMELAASYVFRPGRRARPTLGAASGFVVPVVRSSRAGPDPENARSYIDTRATSAALLWTPTAHAGLRVGLSRSVALQLALFGGPALTVRNAAVATDEPFAFGKWTAGLSSALVFGARPSSK